MQFGAGAREIQVPGGGFEGTQCRQRGQAGGHLL
jgi:hypothetical protein